MTDDTAEAISTAVPLTPVRVTGSPGAAPGVNVKTGNMPSPRKSALKTISKVPAIAGPARPAAAAAPTSVLMIFTSSPLLRSDGQPLAVLSGANLGREAA